MYCNECGMQIPDGSEVCPYCGTPTSGKAAKTDPSYVRSAASSEPASVSAAADTVSVGSQSLEEKASHLSANEKTVPDKPKAAEAPKQMNHETSKMKNSSSSSQKTGSLSPAMILGVAILVLAVIAVPVFQMTGGKLPNLKPKSTSTEVQPKDSENTPEETVKTDENDGSSEAEELSEAPETSASDVPVSDISFQNHAVEEAVTGYFNVSSLSQISEDQLSEIEEISISTYEITVNGKPVEIHSQIGDVDISDLTKNLNHLQSLSIENARTVSVSGNEGLPFVSLQINGGKVKDDLKGIENAVNLKKLIINNTDLSSMKYISGCPALTDVNAANNAISDIEDLRNTDQITNLTIYGNKINDYTALNQIKMLNVWGENFNPDEPLSYAIEKKPDAYCFTVKITNLHMRAKPSASDSSKILIRHIPQQYYIILDVKSAEGYTWYKVGNDAWVADNGKWLTFYNG